MQAEHITVTAPLISPGGLLAVYCVLVLLASLAGGWLLLAIHLTHTRLQMAVSFVAGLMLGISLLHFLPDANEHFLHSLDKTVNWLLGGFLADVFCAALLSLSSSRFAGRRSGRLLRPRARA